MAFRKSSVYSVLHHFNSLFNINLQANYARNHFLHFLFAVVIQNAFLAFSCIIPFRFRRPVEERVVHALGKAWHVEVSS